MNYGYYGYLFVPTSFLVTDLGGMGRVAVLADLVPALPVQIVQPMAPETPW